MKSITISTDKNGKVSTKQSKPKKVKKVYTVHYSYYLSDSVEIEAESEEEAKEKCEEMLVKEEIGDILDMEIGEQNIWID